MSIVLSITFLLKQYLSDFTESDKMVGKKPCMYTAFPDHAFLFDLFFEPFMKKAKSVFNCKTFILLVMVNGSWKKGGREEEKGVGW